MSSDPENGLDEVEIADGFGRATVTLKPRRIAPFLGRHPWVFESSIARLEGQADDGDVVDLVSERRRFVARGILNRGSKLRIRLYTWDPQQPLDTAFWRGRIDRAVQLRSALGLDDPARAVRLIFSEADGLSGLVVDRYANHLVVQVNSLAIAHRLDQIVGLLVEMLAPQSVTVRSEAGISRAEGISVEHGVVWGQRPDGPVFIEEHGLRYGVDLGVGQKTGFYLDQRDNRRVAAGYMRKRRVLDLFCYTGGFSMCASRLGQASEVLAIDSSERSIAMAQANAELNRITNVQFQRQDCFRALDAMSESGQSFDAIVLDPPKFTRTKRSVNEALRAYHRINRVAVDLLQRDGILVTCSCSGSVTRDDFLKMLAVVAQKSGRDIQILEQRGPSVDHPVSPTCLENEYLKCFICRVV